MSFAQIVERARNLVDRSKVFFVVGTLEYLQRGGRIGRVSATLGEFLNVKPIISINKEGVYYTYKKIRGRRRSIDELFSIAREFIEKQKCRVAVMHGACPEEAAYLVKKVEELATVVELVTGPLGPVMGSTPGRGCWDLLFAPA